MLMEGEKLRVCIYSSCSSRTNSGGYLALPRLPQCLQLADGVFASCLMGPA